MIRFLPLLFLPIPAYVLGVFISNIFLLKYLISIPFLLVFVIIWITFINVNPYDTNQNKYTILENIPSEFIPKMTMVSDVDPNKLEFPLILKPVICSKTGNDVYKINNFEELKNINFTKNYMIQEYSPYDREVGILYERMPWEENGRIISIIEKLGNSPIRKWCYGDDKCKNRKDLITDQLQFTIDKISKLIPNFYVGRYDVRFKDDSSFSKGENFHVVEVNGTLGFDLAKGTESFVDVSLINQRWFWMRILCGLYNIFSLNGYGPGETVEVMSITLANTLRCKDWEKLFSLYT